MTYLNGGKVLLLQGMWSLSTMSNVSEIYYNLRCSETCPLGGIRWDAKKKPKKSTLKSPIELKTDNPPETLNIDESEEQNDFLLTPT